MITMTDISGYYGCSQWLLWLESMAAVEWMVAMAERIAL